ncbi:hypothetical protein BCR39DRAFT_531433 [Naematelia encephala]|uniref:Uncharacterized protein n=1 Tax=Naematelia encephala TaxID=71784 RepID=A0A1Y2B490_9TREE|nr:hypothetical protein BCR39DRAFT_531433 [Naematelia encephala]
MGLARSIWMISTLVMLVYRMLRKRDLKRCLRNSNDCSSLGGKKWIKHLYQSEEKRDGIRGL